MKRASTSSSLGAALGSWRLGAVTLMSLSSGLPLGFVLTAMPAWLAYEGVDIRTIGVVTLAQAPYAFKFLWAPLLDRFRPMGLGRKRGWVLVGQLALALLTFVLAVQATTPTVALVASLTLLIAFASATQDIAIDGYAVEALERHEQGVVVGARVAMYRLGMWFAGNIAITLAPSLGWSWTLGLQAAIYLALVPVTYFAPEPKIDAPPPQTLAAAVWEPFVGFFRQPRALEIALFVLLYKLADNLAGALVRPFLAQHGYDAIDVGIASGTIGLIGMMVGTFAGGVLTNLTGVGRALWICGILQAVSNVGYALVAAEPPSRPLLYGAMAVESATSGLGNGAFGVLLLRLTQKRFSATQYALFSSIFAIGRTISGPPSGVLADALGWRDFFLFTIPCALPGLVMLQRFVPWHARELPELIGEDEAVREAPLSRSALVFRGVAGAAAGVIVGLLSSATLTALKESRGGGVFDPVAALNRLVWPGGGSGVMELAAPVLFGVMLGLGVAAASAARRGVARSKAEMVRE